MLESDVRVDFGVRTDNVTWRGTLYGKDGQPLPEASVFLFWSPPSYVDHERLRAHSRAADCDEEGRFEFRKVPPGRYDLSLRLAGSSLLESPLPVVLETPGLHEEDIRLDQWNEGERCRIRGVVIDEATGMPIETDGRVDVVFYQHSPTFRSWRPEVQADGSFFLDDLPAGQHQVSASAEGWAFRSVQVVLREDQPVDDLRLVLSRSGTWLLRLAGFRAFAPRNLRFALRPAEEGQTWQHLDQLPENGNYEISWPLLPGSWTVTLSLEELGVAERAFSIQEGRTTLLVIRPEDLLDATTTVTVAGDVRREDGTPVPGVSLSFWGGDIPGIAEADRSRSVAANGVGEFEIAGLLPGRWKVRGTIHGSSPIFSDLAIPIGAADPFPVHLVLPGGRLTGTLFDRRTGLPLGDDAPPRWLFLGPAGGGEHVCEIQGGQTGSRFEMDGIPEGDWVLTVTARIFSNYTSDPFHHPGAGVLDLGRIELEPCGVLELEVVDEAGLRVREFDVYLDGQVLPSWERWFLGEGRSLLSHLPLRKATIEVRAEGFRTSSEELSFGADAPTRHRFVLKRL
jgi:protocatechuate 3,4-dioxygenase beta subunit